MTVAAVFNSRAAAEKAVDDLRAAKFDESRISVIARDRRTESETDVEEEVAEGAASGAALGAMAGAGTLALGSLAISLGIIPVIGPILAIGPLAAALISATGGALGGAAAGGLVGSLVAWGVTEDEAKYYESEVRAGRFLVTVECHDNDGEEEDARDIFRRHGGLTKSPMIGA